MERRRLLAPQLPSTADDVNVLMQSDKWSISQKVDGERCLVETLGHGIAGYNRRGMPRVMEPQIRTAMQGISGGWVFDGEVLNNTYHVFDVISTPKHGLGFQRVGFGLRFKLLQNMCHKRAYGMHLITHYFGLDDKIDFYQLAHESAVEGVVFKHIDLPYTPGRNKHFLKEKFIKDVDVIVTDQGVNGRNNFSLSVYDGDVLREVGKVSALTGDGPSITVGDVVTVQILYVTDGGHLYQPVTPRKRTDKLPKECTMMQLFPYQTSKVVL
jgi:ATP-dependent DNA ligase